jgi:putative transposase
MDQPISFRPSAAAIAAKRTAFVRKWRLKCRAVADRLKEAREKLFTFCAQCR